MPPEALSVVATNAADVLLVRFAVAKEFIPCARAPKPLGRSLV
jgi:hypothetical protein